MAETGQPLRLQTESQGVHIRHEFFCRHQRGRRIAVDPRGDPVQRGGQRCHLGRDGAVDRRRKQAPGVLARVLGCLGDLTKEPVVGFEQHRDAEPRSSDLRVDQGVRFDDTGQGAPVAVLALLVVLQLDLGARRQPLGEEGRGLRAQALHRMVGMLGLRGVDVQQPDRELLPSDLGDQGVAVDHTDHFPAVVVVGEHIHTDRDGEHTHQAHRGDLLPAGQPARGRTHLSCPHSFVARAPSPGLHLGTSSPTAPTNEDRTQGAPHHIPRGSELPVVYFRACPVPSPRTRPAPSWSR